MVGFIDLGFAPGYRIDMHPALPPSGIWELPQLHFGPGGREDLAIRVDPLEGAPWLAFFAAGPEDYVVGAFAGPSASQLLVATGIEATLIDVDDPMKAQVLAGIAPVTLVLRPTGTDLLLIASFNDPACIDGTGVRWTTSGLFIDDLEVAGISSGIVRVHGYRGAVPRKLEERLLDSRTGEAIIQ